jgi:hypothetical protein
MGDLLIGSLPDEVQAALDRRCGRRLPRATAGRGKPPDTAASLLAENVLNVLKEHRLSDAIWREPNDDEGCGGRLSLAAELEAIAHAALGDATGKARGLEARPARISKARKLLAVERPRVLR